MSQVTETWPEDGFALISLGDLYRYEEQFEPAIDHLYQAPLPST